MRSPTFISTSGITSHEGLAARVVNVGILVAVVAVLVQSCLHIANKIWIGSSHLNADVDGNALTWFTASATILAAFGLSALAAVARSRTRLVLVAGILFLLALDDVVAVHERVSIKLSALVGIDGDYARVVWPALYLPLLLLAFHTLWQQSAPSAGQAGSVVRVGLGCLVAAVGAEVVWAAWHLAGGRIGDWPDTIQVAIEEGLELAGWILIACGLSALALSRIHTMWRAKPDDASPVATAAGHRHA